MNSFCFQLSSCVLVLTQSVITVSVELTTPYTCHFSSFAVGTFIWSSKHKAQGMRCLTRILHPSLHSGWWNVWPLKMGDFVWPHIFKGNWAHTWKDTYISVFHHKIIWWLAENVPSSIGFIKKKTFSFTVGAVVLVIGRFNGVHNLHPLTG